MAKATLELPNGTKVTVEGTPEEVSKLLDYYGSGGTTKGSERSRKRQKIGTKSKKSEASEATNDNVDLSEIINLIKNCDEAEVIETRILDERSSVNRVLLPLYIVHEHCDNAFGLTSGHISKITTDLGVPINQPNVARTLSGTASKYVVGDKVRKKGHIIHYKISRPGLKYLSAVIRGTEDDK